MPLSVTPHPCSGSRPNKLFGSPTVGCPLLLIIVIVVVVVIVPCVDGICVDTEHTCVDQRTTLRSWFSLSVFMLAQRSETAYVSKDGAELVVFRSPLPKC